VFLSYASEDTEAARRICDALRAAGIEVWFDQSELRGGDVWDQKIRREIHDCALFIPVISANTASRHEGYFRLEWDLADQRSHMMARDRAFIVPVCLDATPSAGTDVPEAFHRVQWTRIPEGNPSSAFIDRVLRLLAPSEAPARQLGASARAASSPAAPRTAPRRTSALRVALLGVIVVTVISIAYVASKKLIEHATAVADETSAPVARRVAAAPTSVAAKSIAVLPFTDMSEKRDQEYFADGMAEEIIDLLAKVPELRVPARTSSFYFKGKQAKIPDIARELSVANVLEGSVRRSGDRLRVTAQLVRADTGFHLWSQTYDRDVHDVFSVQDDIANSVVQALQITLMGGPLTRQQGGTENLEAYLLYLRGSSATLSNSRPELEAARGYLEQSIKLDPDFALAWTAQAFVGIELTEVRAVPPAQGFEESRRLAQHALELSPELANAHWMLGYVHRTWDWNWAAAHDEVQRALAIDPRLPQALLLAGQIAATLGHWDEGERQLRAGLNRDPLNTFLLFNLATTLYRAGRFADAEASYRRLIETAPKFAWARGYLAKTLLADGKAPAALEILQQERDEGDRLDHLPMVLWALGRRSEANAGLKSLIDKFADTDAYYIAMNYAYRDDHPSALQWLDRAYRQREFNMGIEIVGESMFKNVANDPGYKSLLRKMNLPE
jgi:TolB-like protein/Tfp pilus assembly protein PilF